MTPFFFDKEGSDLEDPRLDGMNGCRSGYLELNDTTHSSA
jgi:hypothetical protein